MRVAIEAIETIGNVPGSTLIVTDGVTASWPSGFEIVA